MQIKIKLSCKSAPAHLRGILLAAAPEGKLWCKVVIGDTTLILHTDSITLVNPEKQLTSALKNLDEWDFIREYCYRNGIKYVPSYVGGGI